MLNAAARLVNLLGKFRRDARGNIAITFALSLIPVTGLVGAAIDYSSASRIRSQLQAAADAATIGAIAKASTSFTAASNMSADGTVTNGDVDAKRIFNASILGKTGFTLGTVTAQVTRSSGLVKSQLSFTATVPTSVMGIMGFRSITVGGSSYASVSLPVYADFYLLLDNTPSMGVGATTDDINKMVANTPDKCAFACHDLSDPSDYYSLAKKLGVTMRIDVLRSATQQMMDTAQSTQMVSGQIRMAIYTFGASAQKAGLTTIASLSSNLTSAKTAAGAIDLMTVPYQNYASDTDTNLDQVLSDMNIAIPNPGDGSTSSKPLKYLFFVSDGVADEVNSASCTQPTTNGTDPQTKQNYVRCQEPLTVSYCDAIKKRNIKIAVLYTTYLPLPTNAWYNSWIAPFSDSNGEGKIAANMQACASPGLYFEVSPSQGIADAMNALFKKTVTEAHLTR